MASRPRARESRLRTTSEGACRLHDAHARPQQRLDDGLADEVVGAALERVELVALLGLGRDHDDERVDLLAGADPLHQPLAVHPRHAQVRDHQVGGALAHPRHRLDPVGGRLHLDVLDRGDGVPDHLEGDGIVVDDQDGPYGLGLDRRGPLLTPELLYQPQGVPSGLSDGDAPARVAPGDGKVNFKRLMEEIAASGYRGWISAEYLPGDRPTEDSLRWFRKYRSKA